MKVEEVEFSYIGSDLIYVPVQTRWIMRFVIMAILLSVACVSCSYINDKLGIDDDSILEELAESILEGKTGMKLDLTPRSPERK